MYNKYCVLVRRDYVQYTVYYGGGTMYYMYYLLGRRDYVIYVLYVLCTTLEGPCNICTMYWGGGTM